MDWHRVCNQCCRGDHWRIHLRINCEKWKSTVRAGDRCHRAGTRSRVCRHEEGKGECRFVSLNQHPAVGSDSKSVLAGMGAVYVSIHGSDWSFDRRETQAARVTPGVLPLAGFAINPRRYCETENQKASQLTRLFNPHGADERT